MSNEDQKPMTDARLAHLKGGLMNPSCKTLAREAAQELVDEVDRLRADNLILRGDLIKARAEKRCTNSCCVSINDVEPV